MFERTMDAGDRTTQEASSNSAYQSLFADAYDLPRALDRKHGGKPIVAR